VRYGPRSYGEGVAVRVGLVGTGRRATEVHAPTLTSSPGIEFAGVWGRTRLAAEALAQRYGVPAYGSFDELVQHCDAVAFAVPPPVQAELAADAARHGRALLLERPIAGDVAGAEELSRAVERAKVVTQVALMWRYAETVRHFLTAEVPKAQPVGGVGRLISAAPPGLPSWRLERGVLRDQGVDLIDLLDAALGPVAGVRGHGDPRGWVGLLLEQPIGHVSEASLYALAPPGTVQAQVEVYGPAGFARVDCGYVVGPPVYERMYAEFAAAVQHGTPHELDVRRGSHLQQVIEAAETDVRVGV
jgi:predicted dehydrogenase